MFQIRATKPHPSALVARLEPAGNSSPGRLDPSMEDTMKHTPGPWHLTLHGTDVFVWGPDGTKRGCIAQVNMYGDDTREQREANARLIAAAPELLDALKALLALVEDNTLVRNISDDAKPGFAIRQLPLVRALAHTHAAIAKAEGS